MENEINIILIEDREDDIFILGLYFEKEGWKLSASLKTIQDIDNRLEEELAAVDHARCVILLDGSLPEAAGLTSETEINTSRAITIARRLDFNGPIIAISGSDDNNDTLVSLGANYKAGKYAKEVVAAIKSHFG